MPLLSYRSHSTLRYFELKTRSSLSSSLRSISLKSPLSKSLLAPCCQPGFHVTTHYSRQYMMKILLSQCPHCVNRGDARELLEHSLSMVSADLWILWKAQKVPHLRHPRTRDKTKHRVHCGVNEDSTKWPLTGNATKPTDGAVLYWQADGIIVKVLLSMLVSRTINFAHPRELFYNRQTAFGISVRQECWITNAILHQLANRRPAAHTCTSYGTGHDVPSTPQIVYPTMLTQVLRLSIREGMKRVSSRDCARRIF